MVRTDAEINFDWGEGAPPGHADGFRCRWTVSHWLPEANTASYCCTMAWRA